MEERHWKIAEVTLAAADKYGFALAGGYAVRAHGIGNRPSGDVDLFTDWQRRADFPAAVDAAIASLEENGYSVSSITRSDTFARLLVHHPNSEEAEPDKVELSVDWRCHPPVTLDVGPVLHPDDAVANKMCALYGRALARDFLDIDAILSSDRYTREGLLALAHNADPGFDIHMFAGALGALRQITDAAFAEYDVPVADITAMRKRFASWREQLLGG